MLDERLLKIESDGTAELIYLVLGSIIMFTLQKSYRYVRQNIKRIKISLKLKKYRDFLTKTNVLSLENGDPEFANSNIHIKEASNLGEQKCLFIGIPDKYLKQVRQKEHELNILPDNISIFHQDQSFNGKNEFSDIQEKTGIENLNKLIEEHREIVAQHFVESSNGLKFNGQKYGIFDLKFTRFGKNENPGAVITLFKTDYFTHRIFRSIYHQLKSENHEIKNSTADNFLKYNPFLTSFGLNTVLICHGEKGKEVVLSKRSGRVHGDKSRYHISMNEGLSQTDKDAFGKVDLELCFRRGLMEEIGIDNNIYQLASRTAFYDFFLEKTNFEVGLTSAIEIDAPFHANIEPLIARDKAFETDKFEVIPMATKHLKLFVDNHEFVPHGIYTLNHVLLREGISLMSIDS